MLAFGSLAALWASAIDSGTGDKLRVTIRRRFPQVRQLPTSDLAAWLADDTRPAPLLIDARTAREYAVSHLPGARHARKPTEVLALLADPQKDRARPIVVYCSVGYRSASLAARLQARGFTRVFNLEGAIFQWANEDRPLRRGSRPVQEVHPYDAKWGQLLDTRHHPKSPTGSSRE